MAAVDGVWSISCLAGNVRTIGCCRWIGRVPKRFRISRLDAEWRVVRKA